MTRGQLILENEPLRDVLIKWSGWMAVMVVFAMIVIYFSNYFAAHMNECFLAGEYHTGNIIQDLKNKKWRSRFKETDKLTYI